MDISDDERCPELSLKNECLDAPHCEPLEELLKRVQFEKIDVESSSLDDEVTFYWRMIKRPKKRNVTKKKYENKGANHFIIKFLISCFQSATILFDMLEYYQSARHLNMSSNRNIGARGWQACAQMIKKVRSCFYHYIFYHSLISTITDIKYNRLPLMMF